MASVSFPCPGTSLACSLRLDLDVASQDIGTNETTLDYESYIRRDNTSGTGTFDTTNTCTAYLRINGVVLKNNTVQNYDFRASSGMGDVGDRVTIRNGSLVIPHNADGTKTISYTLSFTDPGSEIIGDASLSGSMVLPVIPRGGADYYEAAWAEQYVEWYDLASGTWKLQAVEHYDGAGWVRQN